MILTSNAFLGLPKRRLKLKLKLKILNAPNGTFDNLCFFGEEWPSQKISEVPKPKTKIAQIELLKR